MSNLVTRSGTRGGAHFIIIGGLLIASASINLLQARKIARLETTLTTLKSEGQLTVGTSVPTIEAKDLNGNSITLSYAANGPATILYVFSPQCKWCERNLVSLRTLANGIKGRYRFATIALNEQGLGEYITAKEFRFPVYTGLSADTLRAYKFGGTPQTVVISADGHVQKSWMGAYVGETKKDVESFFNIELPDIAQK